MKYLPTRFDPSPVAEHWRPKYLTFSSALMMMPGLNLSGHRRKVVSPSSPAEMTSVDSDGSTHHVPCTSRGTPVAFAGAISATSSTAVVSSLVIILIRQRSSCDGRDHRPFRSAMLFKISKCSCACGFIIHLFHRSRPAQDRRRAERRTLRAYPGTAQNAAAAQSQDAPEPTSGRVTMEISSPDISHSNRRYPPSVRHRIEP
jgi:hypothetical protein